MIQQSLKRAARPILFEEFAMQRDAKIIAMDANGCNVADIAEALDLAPSTVARVLRENGR